MDTRGQSTLRRTALGLAFAALWIVPHFFDSRPSQPKWYALFGLNVVWVALLVRSVTEDLPRLAQGGPIRRQLPWMLAFVTGSFALFAAWAVGHPVSWAVWVHGEMLREYGMTVGLSALAVWISRALRKPIDVANVRFHRSVAGIAFCLVVVPQFHAAGASWAGVGQLCIFTLACCTMWLRELPAFERKAAGRKWRVRLTTLALATVINGVRSRREPAPSMRLRLRPTPSPRPTMPGTTSNRSRTPTRCPRTPCSRARHRSP
jgi:hypothetical protein